MAERNTAPSFPFSPTAIAELLDAFRSDEQQRQALLGSDWVKLYAAESTIALDFPNAAATMRKVYEVLFSEDRLKAIFQEYLRRFGPAVFEPFLAEVERRPSHEMPGSFCYLLAGLGFLDDRIFAACKALFERNRFFGSICLAEYGDERALPLLESTLHSMIGRMHTLAELEVVNELRHAYERIAGGLPAELSLALGRLEQEWAVRNADRVNSLISGSKLGRNERCFCGSGKKYKHCCSTRPAPVAVGGRLH
jgi:hypothetical protein